MPFGGLGQNVQLQLNTSSLFRISFQPYDSDSDSDYDMEIHDLTAYTDDDFIEYAFGGLGQKVQPKADDANNADSGPSDEMDVDNRSDDDASQNKKAGNNQFEASLEGDTEQIQMEEESGYNEPQPRDDDVNSEEEDSDPGPDEETDVDLGSYDRGEDLVSQCMLIYIEMDWYILECGQIPFTTDSHIPSNLNFQLHTHPSNHHGSLPPKPMSLNILDLPVDILALVLSPLLTQDQPIPLCPCGSTDSPERSIKINPLPILLIHPAIYAIAVPLFYQCNNFVLDLRLKHGPHVRRCLDDQAEEDAFDAKDQHFHDDSQIIRLKKDVLVLQCSLRRIRSLEIKILKLRGWIDVHVVPLVRDMTVNGTLSDVTIKIYSSSTTSNADPTPSIFTRPPLAGILSLLSDPYLRTARLWVSPAANAAWLPFWHSTSNSDENLMEINWASILRQVDPEGRRIAILADDRK
ncbi:hypothetical protein VFPPC_08364 [Pochonia chlamydosporia 170]|uniref:F-box domain-containing protein n=1 Tax=Pochonia chlamydosporia 170 TaxID=1380566 RepID=A0A179FMN5_METCM|nr:hypothetical protein VFPPC_08364 [Pochonia chlamydosporia 170]OAQ66856.2 hypothetical protein VFPPC_08364 [Pochonia chlamydosporia 170]